MTANNAGTKYFSVAVAQGDKSFDINADLTDSQIDRIIDNVLIPTFNPNYAREQVNEKIQGKLDLRDVGTTGLYTHTSDHVFIPHSVPTADEHGEIKMLYARSGVGKSRLFDAQKLPTEISDEAKRIWNERELQKGYEETVVGVNPERTEYNEEVKVSKQSKGKVELQGNHGTSTMADILGAKKVADLASKNGLSPKAYESKDAPITAEKSFGDVAEADKEKDYFRTGIKIKNDKPNYRVGYDCPKCGNTGRHYVPQRTNTVTCHNCHSPLEVEPATMLGQGFTEQHRDANGNFFVATSLSMHQYDRLLKAGRINTDLHRK